MRRVLVHAALIALVIPRLAAAQDPVARGATVYTAQKCSLCHSVAGKGNKKGALDAVGTKLSADELRAWITDAVGQAAKAKATRKPPMKNYALPKEDVDALVAYLASLKQ